MICYYYPPLTDVGSKRSVAFAKYFKKHGWTPYVLSVKNPDKTFCSIGSDTPPNEVFNEYSYSMVNCYKLLGKMNSLIVNTANLFGIYPKRNYLYDIFCIPDIFFGWIPLTTLKAYILIKKFDIDIIYVSCSPFSSALIGTFLKAITRKPFILDFRDPYSLDIISLTLLSSRPTFRKVIDRCFEHRFIAYADVFLTTTNTQKNLYARQYPEAKHKIFCVHNGFDADLLDLGEFSVAKYSKFTIVYPGRFYFTEAGTGLSFFEALCLLKQREIINSYDFQFIYYGEEEEGAKIERISRDFAVKDLVKTFTRVSYSHMLAILAKSHLQLLRLSKVGLATKLFDGLSTNLPFIATQPHAEARAIIRKYSPASYIIDQDSPEYICNAIADAIAKYKNNQVFQNRTEDFLRDFSRENLTLKLMRIIENSLDVSTQ